MSFIRKIKKGDRVYLAEVENKRVKGKCVQRHIRYVGREADGRTVLSTSLSDVQVDQVKLYGPLLALNHLASEIDLSGHLGEYGNEILSMVYAHCLDYESLNQMPSWFEKTDLNMILNLEGLTEKRLENALDALERSDSEGLQLKIFKAVRERYQLKNSGVIYDVTNTYLYGKNCGLGKLGHDKEGVKGRPLIQIGLGATNPEAIPVFHKTFDGNVHDSKTLQDLITTFPRYGMTRGLLIYDRGITSGRNLADVKALKWQTLCGVALNPALKRFWQPTIASKNLVQLSHRVPLNKNVFYVVTEPYEIDGVKGELALCLNEQQRRDLRESRYDDVTHAQGLLKAKKAIKPGLEKYFDKKGNLLRAKIEEAEEFDGYSCLFSTRRLHKEEFVRLYFGKDLIEKAFRTLKGITKLQPVRFWLSERVVAHVFICYLAYLLLSLLQYRLRSIGISAEEALRDLGTMYKVYLRDSKAIFKLSRVVTLTKKQELILKAIDKKLLKT